MSLTQLTSWLDSHSQTLDCGAGDAEQVLAQLADSGVLGLGIPVEQGGTGGSLAEALESVSQVASHSLTAAFVLWGQRVFIEYLLHSDNQSLRERLLPDLLAGRLAGATGLSNAMKFLSGIEELGVTARAQADGWALQGRLPWVTNLRKSGFVVAAAVDLPGSAPFIAALPDNLPGLTRSEDFELLGMQCSNTAALTLEQVQLGREWLIAADAPPFLRAVRPAFLGLQCGLSIGLARRCLHEVAQLLGGHRSILEEDWRQLDAQLHSLDQQLRSGVNDGRYAGQPVSLFQIRIALADVAVRAVQLELQASGGKAYIQPHGEGFARRFRESAFVPVVTPSLVQLRTELQRHAEAAA